MHSWLLLRIVVVNPYIVWVRVLLRQLCDSGAIGLMLGWV